jgi:hypothetical protein
VTVPAQAKLLPPPVQLRALLESARDRGEPFDTAWRRAMDGRRAPGRVVFPNDTLERRGWRIALLRVRREWRAAYNRSGVCARPVSRFLLEGFERDESSWSGFAEGARMARAPMPVIDESVLIRSRPPTAAGVEG